MKFPVPPVHRHARCAAALACCALAGQAWAQAAPVEARPPTLERVEIIGASPIPGTGLDRNQIPGNVQHLGSAKLRDAQAQNLPDLLRSQVGSVSVVETQGNPYQLEVNYRGFTASPLLGQPQGLSVFLDGVRLNEPFGDVVNWDLLPRNALASLTVMPGSNPVYGLNTLGGALALTTKRGDTHAGSEVELAVGSFGRRSLELSHGSTLAEGTHLFVAGDIYQEDGWRAHSPSELRHLFVRLDHKRGPLDGSLSLLGADNRLIGNGLLPESMLQTDRSQIYTRPDQTRNELAGLTGRAGLDLGDGQRLDAQGHIRRLRAHTVNGDLNDGWDGLSADTGVENRSATRQQGSGLTLQWQRRLADSLTLIGLAHDTSRSTFEQTEAEGVLDGSRAVTELADEELNAAISGRSSTRSLYAMTTVQATPALSVTASGRYNDTRVTTVDEGRLRGLTTNLDSDHRFRAFNPALGATWALGPSLTLFGGASQGNRAPSPIELGCSDPEQPCILPNALQSDPPLKQVISRTLEIGLRGEALPGWRWNAGVFSTTNRDDILFVSNGRAAGYFANFGKTRRQGLELGLSGRSGPLDAALHYTRLSATYRSAACLVSEANSTAGTSDLCTGEDEIEVRPGDRLPGLPENILKLDLGWRASPALRLSANWQAQSGVYLRGNENNRHAADGDEFHGSGRVGGFALLNLQARWRMGSGWSLLGKVNNVFNRRYATGGQLGENAFDASGNLQAPADWRNEPFLAPGAPRSFTLALQWNGGAD
jgi:outer membrane receptor protein involved in Fe transport